MATPAGAGCSTCARRRNVGYFPTATGDVPADAPLLLLHGLRPGLFCGPARPAGLSEWGTGFGFFLTAGEHFDARLTIAWALLGAAPVASTAATMLP